MRFQYYINPFDLNILNLFKLVDTYTASIYIKAINTNTITPKYWPVDVGTALSEPLFSS